MIDLILMLLKMKKISFIISLIILLSSFSLFSVSSLSLPVEFHCDDDVFSLLEQATHYTRSEYSRFMVNNVSSSDKVNFLFIPTSSDVYANDTTIYPKSYLPVVSVTYYDGIITTSSYTSNYSFTTKNQPYQNFDLLYSDGTVFRHNNVSLFYSSFSSTLPFDVPTEQVTEFSTEPVTEVSTEPVTEVLTEPVTELVTELSTDLSTDNTFILTRLDMIYTLLLYAFSFGVIFLVLYILYNFIRSFF